MNDKWIWSLEKIQLSDQAFLSGTTLNEQFYLRACIVNPNGSEADLDLLVDLVREWGASLNP